ncbi:MAG: DUF547 domain-containing protein [Ekhidna sp.]|nr:DUF547 domain-containing protein [Ekhidna sp.]
MKRYLLILLAFLSFTAFAQESEQSETLFDDINNFLLDKVVFGLVDYASLQKDPEVLNTIVDKISEYDLKDADQDHKTAFYINAYNMLVIKQVTDKYPISSPMDVEGFFKVKTFHVAGELLTLDAIEFTKLIGPTSDPRIHFALGCGARSCPFLYDNAFYPDKLNEQLEFRAQLIIDRPNYVHVDEKKKKVVFNKIFDWYKDQFEADAGSLINYVNKYRFYKVPKGYIVSFQEYDWTLNNQ